MSTVVPVPEGTVAKRPLQFFWIADFSGSMAGKKIATLNQAIREALLYWFTVKWRNWPFD
jgi:hypothetical protein